MRFFFLLLFIFNILCAGVAHAADWPNPYSDQSNSSTIAYQNELPFTQVASITSQYTTPVIQNNILVTAYSNGTSRFATAYSLPDLKSLWSYSLGSSYPRQLTINRGVVYLGLSTKATILALDLSTGKLMWSTDLPGERTIRNYPVVTHDSIFVAANQLYKLSLDGNLLWSQPYDIESPLATDDAHLYFRIHNLQLLRISSLTGSQEWSYSTSTTSGTQPVLTSDSVYVGTYGYVIGLDKETGKEKWRHAVEANHPNIGSIAYASNRLFYSTNYGDITALDPTGQLIWKKRFNTNDYSGNGWNAPFILAGNRIISRANTLDGLILDTQAGATIFSGPLTTTGLTPAASTGNGIIFTKDTSAYLYSTGATLPAPSPSPSIVPTPSPSPSPSPTLIPTIIVPGIVESWPSNGHWFFDPFLGIFKDLIAGLQSTGYEINKTLYPFGYDWHTSNDITAHYLASLISSIKYDTGADKVNIIAHSMGGLIARSYIQSAYYNNDVANLIMIATPNHGSAKSYLTWEAGETGNGNLDTLKEELLNYEAKETGYANKVVQYIHEKVPTISELLPIFDYLEKDGQNLSYSPCNPTIYPCNSFLEKLNAGLDTLKQRATVTNIIGHNGDDSTYKLFHLLNSSISDLWQHGIPKNYPGNDGEVFDKGDGTVLESSAHIDGVPETIIDTDHTRIVNQSTQTVVKQLTGKDVTGPSSEPVKTFLFIRLYSPINLLLTDPNGKSTGTIPAGNLVISDISNSYYSGNATDQEYAIIPNPSPGIYQLQLTGTGSGSYEVQASLITEDGTSHDVSLTGTTKNNLRATSQLKVEPAALSIITQPSPQLSPTSTTTQSPTSSKTNLAKPSPTPTVRPVLSSPAPIAQTDDEISTTAETTTSTTSLVATSKPTPKAPAKPNQTSIPTPTTPSSPYLTHISPATDKKKIFYLLVTAILATLSLAITLTFSVILDTNTSHSPPPSRK